MKVIEIGAIRKHGYGSYSSSIVTMAVSVAVCEIFSVKEWDDLENRKTVPMLSNGTNFNDLQ